MKRIALFCLLSLCGFVSSCVERITYTVSFFTDGGTPIESRIVNSESIIDAPTIPTKSGCIFEDWYLGDDPYDFTAKVKADITLTAHWKAPLGKYITTVNPLDGIAFDVRNAKIADYIDNFDKCYSAKYKGNKENQKEDQFQNIPIRISWNADQEYDSYIVDITTDPSFTSYKSYACASNSVAVENVYTDTTYYYQVSCVKGTTIYQDNTIHNVFVSKSPRLLSVENVTNIRDIGGYIVGDKVVKQGLVYRSANLDSATTRTKASMKNDFGIKTEIDLRGNQQTSPIDANLVSVTFPNWTGAKGLDNEDYWPAVKQAIQIFTNKNNYPIDFHCAIGQDRTGSLAILLEGLLGVNLRDIYMDYEFTSFSTVCNGDDVVDQAITNKYKYQVEPLITYLKSCGTASDSFQTCVIKYLKNNIGITAQEIETIQSLLLEDK